MDAHTLHSMRLEFAKEASVETPSGGKGEKYLPWYAAAAGALSGSEVAKRAVPPKFRFPAQMLGTLAGTAIGVHGGEAVGKALDKRAAAEKPEHPANTLGKSLAGLGAGTAAGYVAAKGLDAALRRRGGALSPLAMKVMPALTAAGGLAYTTMQQRTLEKMRENHLARKAKKHGRKDS